MWEIYTFFMLLKTILGIFAFSCVWIIELEKLVEGKLGISATTLKKGKKKRKKRLDQGVGRVFIRHYLTRFDA